MGRAVAWTIGWAVLRFCADSTSAQQSMDSLGESSADGKH
jgi:hypothetical protein